MTRFWQATAVAAVVVAAFMGGSTLSWAHGGDSNAVHACTTGVGKPILLSAPLRSCGREETPLDWAIKGPKGDPGPAGPQGPTGEQGPAGPQGSSAGSPSPGVYQIVVKSKTMKPPFNDIRADAWCPNGFQVVNGGYKVTLYGAPSASAPAAASASHPISTGKKSGWSASVIWPKGGTVGAWAICYAPPTS